MLCPNCDYDLRQLAGDPIRCPECGKTHSRGWLRQHGHAWAARRLRRVASYNMLCVPGLPVLFFGLLVWRADIRAGVVFTTIGLATWLFGVYNAKRAAEGRTGWLVPALVLQALGLVWLLLAGSLVPAILLLFAGMSRWLDSHGVVPSVAWSGGFGLALATVAVATTTVVFVTRPLARESMARMGRAFAVVTV